MWLWFNFCTPEPGWLLEMNVFPIGTARPPIPIFPGPYIYIMFDTFKEHWKPKRLISNSDKWNGKWYFRHLSNRIQPQHVHVCVCMHQWIYNCNYQKQNTPRDMCTNRQQTHLHWWCHNPQPSKTLIFYSKRRKGFVFLAYWDISDPFLWAPV